MSEETLVEVLGDPYLQINAVVESVRLEWIEAR